MPTAPLDDFSSGCQYDSIRQRMFKRIFYVVSGLLVTVLLWEWLTFPDVAALAAENPPTTAFIDARLAAAADSGKPPKREQNWVPLEKISPHLVRAVLAGEDARFFEHNGFDYEAIKKAAEKNWEEKDFVRGASTITQQLAKNLYLSESKNPIRKLREAVITWSLERNLTKWRILEIYLNVIEWGDGIYGADAAARTYFGTSAAKLGPSQAAFLAAMIPNPRTVYNPKTNPRNVKRRQRVIERHMRSVRLPKR
jgi:monofunctional biosynthetic peptidoglycan transglycosylase